MSPARISVAGIDLIVKPTSLENLLSMTCGKFNENALISDVVDNYISPGEVVADIGAHTGCWTLPLAHCVLPIGCIYAFEPEHVAARALAGNIRLNRLENVSLFRIALSDRNGRRDFYVRRMTELHSFYSSTVAPVRPEIEHLRSVPARRLDAVVAEKGLKPPTFLKIDVEGAELEVLRGCSGIVGGIDNILIEMHRTPLYAQGINEHDIWNLLSSWGLTEATAKGEYHIMFSRPLSRSSRR